MHIKPPEVSWSANSWTKNSTTKTKLLELATHRCKMQSQASSNTCNSDIKTPRHLKNSQRSEENFPRRPTNTTQLFHTRENRLFRLYSSQEFIFEMSLIVVVFGCFFFVAVLRGFLKDLQSYQSERVLCWNMFAWGNIAITEISWKSSVWEKRFKTFLNSSFAMLAYVHWFSSEDEA